MTGHSVQPQTRFTQPATITASAQGCPRLFAICTWQPAGDAKDTDHAGGEDDKDYPGEDVETAYCQPFKLGGCGCANFICRSGPALALRATVQGSNANTFFQSLFMSTTVQPFALRLIERLVELADLRLPVVGVFALGIGVMDDAGEARAGPCRRPLQHLQIAVGIAEREDRPPADEAVDADRLARPVVDELDLGELHQLRLAVRPISNFTTPDEPTTCSGGMP